jgi:hypothetical protein
MGSMEAFLKKWWVESDFKVKPPTCHKSLTNDNAPTGLVGLL